MLLRYTSWTFLPRWRPVRSRRAGSGPVPPGQQPGPQSNHDRQQQNRAADGQRALTSHTIAGLKDLSQPGDADGRDHREQRVHPPPLPTLQPVLLTLASFLTIALDVFTPSYQPVDVRFQPVGQDLGDLFVGLANPLV